MFSLCVMEWIWKLKTFVALFFFENKANTNCCGDNSKQFRLAFVCVNNFQLCQKDFLRKWEKFVLPSPPSSMFISKKSFEFFKFNSRQLTDLHVKYLRVIMWISVPERVICLRLAHISVFFILFYTFYMLFFCLKYEQKRVSWDKDKTRLMRHCRQNESKWELSAHKKNPYETRPRHGERWRKIDCVI